MICVRNIGLPAETVSALGDAAGLHAQLTASGAYDLPPGYAYDEASRTVYTKKGVDSFRTAKVRNALAIEEAAARNAARSLEMAETAKARQRAAWRRAGQPIPPEFKAAPGWEDPPEAVQPAAAVYSASAVPVYPAQNSPAPAVYAVPISTLPSPMPVPLPEPPIALAPPVADPVLIQAQQESALVAQAAQLVAQYTPVIAQAQSYASQLAAAGRSAEAGQWLDYSRAVAQWVQSLRLTYNVN